MRAIRYIVYLLLVEAAIFYMICVIISGAIVSFIDGVISTVLILIEMTAIGLALIGMSLLSHIR